MAQQQNLPCSVQWIWILCVCVCIFLCIVHACFFLYLLCLWVCLCAYLCTGYMRMFVLVYVCVCMNWRDETLFNKAQCSIKILKYEEAKLIHHRSDIFLYLQKWSHVTQANVGPQPEIILISHLSKHYSEQVLQTPCNGKLSTEIQLWSKHKCMNLDLNQMLSY